MGCIVAGGDWRDRGWKVGWRLDVHFADGAVVDAVEIGGDFVAVREKSCVLAKVEF